MLKLEPTYLRYVYDSLGSGLLSSDNSSSLPHGFVGLFEANFSADITSSKRLSLLRRFTIWSLFKCAVSSSMASEIIEEDEEDTKAFIDTYSKWFNSPEPGKYILYHDRLRTYFLQKLSSHEVQSLNEKLVSYLEAALEDSIAGEAQEYALEHLATHMVVESQLDNSYDRLHDFVNQEDLWKRQVGTSKEYKWSQQAVQYGIKEGARRHHEMNTLTSTVNSVKIMKDELDSVHQIFDLLRLEEFDLAITRVTSFDLRDQIIICLMILNEFLFGKLKDHLEKGKYCKIIIEIISSISNSDAKEFDREKLDLSKYFPQTILYSYYIEMSKIGIDIGFFWDKRNRYELNKIVNNDSVDDDIIFKLLGNATFADVIISIKSILLCQISRGDNAKFFITIDRFDKYFEKIKEYLITDIEKCFENSDASKQDLLFYKSLMIYNEAVLLVNQKKTDSKILERLDSFFENLVNLSDNLKEFHSKRRFLNFILESVRNMITPKSCNYLISKFLDLLKSTRYEKDYIPELYNEIKESFKKLDVNKDNDLIIIFGKDNLFVSKPTVISDLDNYFKLLKCSNSDEITPKILKIIGEIDANETGVDAWSKRGARGKDPEALKNEYLKRVCQFLIDNNKIEDALKIIDAMNSSSSSDLKKEILLKLNNENRFDESIEISNKLGSISYYNNHFEVAKTIINNKEFDRALDFVHASDEIGYGEQSTLYLHIYKSINNKSDDFFIFCAIQFYLYSLIFNEYGNDGEYEENVKPLITNVNSVELLSDVIELLHTSYFTSYDLSQLVESLLIANIDKAQEVVLLINDESLRFSPSFKIIKQKIDSNHFSDIYHVINKFSNPVLKLNLFLETYVYLVSKGYDDKAIDFLDKAIIFSDNLSYQQYCNRLFYCKVLSAGDEKHLRILTSKIKNNNSQKIKDDFINYKFMSFLDIQKRFNINKANTNTNNIDKQIEGFESELFGGEFTEAVSMGIDLLPDIYKYDIEKAEDIVKKLIEKINNYDFGDDYISEALQNFVDVSIQENKINATNIDCLLRIANKILDDSYGGVKSKTFFSIFKYFISLVDYESSIGTLDKIIINEIEYDDFLNQLQLVIDDNHEGIAVDLVCKAKYSDSSTKDLLLNDIILYIYSTRNRVSEDIFNRFDNINQRISAQGNIIGELFLDNDLQENKSIFTSHISMQYVKYEENDSLIMALTDVILNKNIDFNFTYLLSIINDSLLCDKVRFKIIDCYIEKGEALKKIVNIIEINHTNRDEEYERVSKSLSSSKRFDDAVELASSIKYNDNDHHNTLRSDTISAISMDIMKSGDIEKAIQTFEIIDKIDVKVNDYSSLSIELINLFTIDNHQQLYDYLNVINKKKESLYEYSPFYSSSDKSIEEIYSINLAIAYIKMLENFNSKTSAISKGLLDRVFDIVKIIEQDEYSETSAYELFEIGKLLQKKTYVKESQIIIQKALNIFLTDDKMNIEEWCDKKLGAVTSDQVIIDGEKRKTSGHELYSGKVYACERIKDVALFCLDLYKYYYNQKDEVNRDKYLDLTLQITDQILKSFYKVIKEEEAQDFYIEAMVRCNISNHHLNIPNVVYRKVLIELASNNEIKKFFKVLPNFSVADIINNQNTIGGPLFAKNYSHIRFVEINQKPGIKDEINRYINSSDLILNKSKGEVRNHPMKEVETSIVRRLFYLIKFLKELSIVLETNSVKEIVNLYLEDTQLLHELKSEHESLAYFLLADFYLDLSKDCDTIEASDRAIKTAKELSKNITAERNITALCTSLAKVKDIKEAVVFLNSKREKVNLKSLSKNLVNVLVDSKIDHHEDYIFLSNFNNHPKRFYRILQRNAHRSLFLDKERDEEKLNLLAQVIDIDDWRKVSDDLCKN